MSVWYGEFELSLTLKAPFLIAGTMPVKFGVDLAQMRNHNGDPIIPDSHIKGVLKHAWEALEDHICGLSVGAVFGSGGDEAENHRGSLWFMDLAASENNSAPNITRVGIDPETGAAKAGALYVIEQIVRPGDEVTFSGKITLRASNREQAEKIHTDLKSSLNLVASVGKFKSAGFGRVIGRSFGDLLEFTRVKYRSFDPQPWVFKFQTDKPLLVDTTRPDGNMFFSNQVISGGTLKGALAARLRHEGYDPENDALGALISKLTICHAFPDIPGLRPVPFDHVQLDREQKPVPFVETDDLNFSEEKSVPSFTPDFKGDSGQTYLDRDSRTHVEISAERGAAQNGSLFSASSILHENDGKPLSWASKIIPPDNMDTEEKDALNLCMNTLQNGLFAIGKTKARTLCNQLQPIPGKEDHSLSGDWRLVLDTPLLMLREFHMSDEKRYWEAIERYWHKATDGAYRLKWTDGYPMIFARHSFASGYPAIRFTWFGEDRLESFVLTEPGSVFFLECVDPSKAADIQIRLRSKGLPVARWNKADELEIVPMPDYQKCPYGAQNGYGHIRAEGAT